MVHSPMSLHLFEQNNRFTPLAPPASPTKSAPCALPNLEYSQPPDSSTLIHSSKNIGGIPLFFPFRNPLHSHSCPVRTPLHLPPSTGETQTLLPIRTDSTLNMECGAPAPLSTNNTEPPKLHRAKILTHGATLVFFSRPHPQTSRGPLETPPFGP